MGTRILSVAVFLCCAAVTHAQAPVTYHVSFPEAQHHLMQVEVTFADVPAGALEIVMSRTSPGRYAVHGFVRNVYDVQIDDGAGSPLGAGRPSPSEWSVAGHRGTVRVRYKVFGDHLNATHLAIDSTHAHLNIPASFMWARGFEDRPARVTFDPPAQWKIATQLHATGDPRTFTAGSLHYLIDSPVELSAFALRTFTVERELRAAIHHDGSDADADRFAAGLETIVREQRAVFGELPAFEAPYTFIADYLPWATFDAMEHRNSTVLTEAVRLRMPDERLSALANAAHEFFHSWNVERIRPQSLEPFRLDAPNASGELWFAEGFTNYYAMLTMRRAGLFDIDEFAGRTAQALDVVIRSPARKYSSPEDVSRFAQFVDTALWTDPTNLDNHYVSYYDWGHVIALGLDLSLRVRTNHKVTLDDYMRRLWQEFGTAKATIEGTVSRGYTAQDLRRVLADVSDDHGFADDFFKRFVHGREVVDYAPLLARAGLILRKAHPGQPWIGPVLFHFDGGSPRIAAPTIEDTPAYASGLDRGDELLSFDGLSVKGTSSLDEAVQRQRPGDRVRLTIRRRGVTQELSLTVSEDPRLELVPVERTGRQPTAEERAFRNAWLASRQ